MYRERRVLWYTRCVLEPSRSLPLNSASYCEQLSVRVLPLCVAYLPVLQRTLLGRRHLLAQQPTVLAAYVDTNRLSRRIIIMCVELELQLATAPVHALGTPYCAPLTKPRQPVT